MSKDDLIMRLQQSITQLKQAEKAVYREEMTHASVYVENAKGILMKLGGQLK